MAILLCNFSFAQQISVQNNVPVGQLVEDALGQNCVEISNVNSPVNGSIVGMGSFGSFQRGASNFPFESGIVLTTGNATSAGNTLNNEVLNEGNSNWPTDADLENTLGLSNTTNATTIEFDFISISSVLQFNYILASEEYFANFPCLYSDGFAFLIRRAGTNEPYTNIALIPGTSIPVNSNTVHPEIEGFCDPENENFFEGFNIGDTNYNGRTTVLTATANIIPDETYHIKLIIADQTDRNYDSAVFIEANSFNPTIDLGADIETCASSVQLNGDINNANAEYTWFLNNEEITDVDSSSYEVTQSGLYRVEASVPLGGDFCIIEDEININISNTQSSTPISNFELCDDPSNDGVSVFNLNTKNDEVINSVAPGNYTISYHTSPANAQSNTDPIIGDYTNVVNPQLIFVRIEDTDNGCLAFNQFQIEVNPLPEITQPSTLEVCDDEIADGFTAIDLSQVNDQITNGQNNMNVTFHFTQNDANVGANPIPLPYVNSGANDQVFVSVSNPQTGCISTTTLNITVLEPPVLADFETFYIDACDPDYDGFANFDLTTLEPEILNGLTNVSTSYYTSQDDALTGTNPIVDPTDFENTVQTEQTVFIRVVDNTTGCATLAPIEAHPNLLLTAPNFDDTLLCDNENDGTEPFNLISITGDILDEIQDVSITYYETESDRDSATNPIDINVDYIPASIPQTLYITLTSPTCSENEEIILDLNPIVEFDDIPQQVVCDEDQDGLTTVDLSQYNSALYDNQPGFQVTYFESLADAEANANSIGTFYNNSENPFTVYARIRSIETSCTDISSFEILVNPAPESNTPNPIVICDNDNDGFFRVNLNDTSQEIIGNTPNRNLTFFNTLQDADNNTNAITNSSDYDAETETVYVRINNTLTGCHSTEALSITVNTLPVFPEISNFRFCENNTDNVGEFLLSSKDAEILNGQPGKEVLYFLNENDALNNNNEIDKNSNYENTSNPQEIFIRVQNVTDTECFGIDSFILEVGTNPTFNEPSDRFVCDDTSNDTFASINLDEIRTEINQGIAENLDINFYLSVNDLNTGSNPITTASFTNTTNPQDIFVEIANGSICTSVTSFTINVIPVPSVLPIDPFEDCDIDYDGSISWNLTDAEINIQDVRQDNIEVSYFESIENAENNNGAIGNPENFVNSSNPQTVYVRVNNTDFNCPVILPIELIVNTPPAFNAFEIYETCDNEDGIFNLNEINSIIVDEADNTAITYFSNEQDALEQINNLGVNYTYQSNSDIIYARLDNTVTGCFYIYPFMLAVNELPIANDVENLEECDDDYDGLLAFDLERQTNTILGNQDDMLFSVTYHQNLVDANTNSNVIDGLFEAFNGQRIYARVTNNSTGCYIISEFRTIINPKPFIDIEDQTICPENFPLVVNADTGNAGDTYDWSTGSNTAETEITLIGTYSVTITTENGCTYTDTFEVIESEPANIEVVETVDFSDPNNITITVNGIGNYLFQLNDGLPQESNIFENVSLGYHLLTIIDLNGCSSVTRDIVVIDAPKFFTPNNDGAFDTWHISGVETLPGTVIYIFDRYGKLLTQLSSSSPGWDGTYNGNLMPTSDYWFSAEVKQGNEAFTVKGHFTLKR